MTLDETIAGHRVLRLLATGTRSRVWLVAGDRVLKVLPAHDAATEALTLHRARGEHVVELLDASIDDDRAALVFPRLPRGSLADIIGRHDGLDAGEAVTALAPIAGALTRMHGAGVSHGALSAGHVLFRDDGAPMLIGFGSATTFEAGLPEVALERLDGVVQDRVALASLACSVLARVTGPRAPAAAALAARLRAGELDDLEARLGRDLFELAAARPVRLEGGEADPSSPRRVVAVAQPAEPLDAPEAGGVLGGRLTAVVGSALESGVDRIIRSILRERWVRLSAAQRKALLAAAAGVVVLVVAIAAVPAAPDPSAHDTGALGAPPDATPAPQGSADDVAPAVTGDDPLAALDELLPRRAECFRQLSVLCLDEVDAPGSAALDDDRAALAALVERAVQPPAIDAEGAALAERLGDGALITLAPDSEPASVLLLKGEAGWRIRDYVAESGAG